MLAIHASKKNKAIAVNFTPSQMEQLDQDIKNRTNTNGFIDLSVNLVARNGIVIVAPADRLSDQTRQTDLLAQQLKAKNTPFTRIEKFHTNFDSKGYSQQALQLLIARASRVMQSISPLWYLSIAK